MSRSERRQLTVVFTDLVNSTAMASALDPEDWHELLDAYQHRVAEAIQSNGGVVTQFQGDGVVAYFGWPTGTDGATRDAVAAGLAIVDAVAHVAGAGRVSGVNSLSARVGIDTGVVVVAESTAGGVVRPADIFGETPNMAARLQTLAGPGQVLISESTAALVVGWFELEPLGPKSLKGFPSDIEVFRVEAATGIRSRLDSRDLTKFVGRQPELGELMTHWDAACSGRARVVVIAGDAGMGKSRLVREFVSNLHDAPEVMIAACSERDSLSPMQPFESVFGQVPTRTSDAVAWMTERVDARPSVLIVDDAHWADPSTLEVLERVQPLDIPLLMLVTSRPTGEGRLEFVRHTLQVGELGADDSAAVVDSLSASFPLPLDVRETLVDRAGGVPLFLEELMRSAHDDSRRGRRTTQVVPPTLADLVNSRLDRLGGAKAVAQIASVIGTEFDVDTLEAVGTDDQLKDGTLALLVSNGIVQPLGEPGAFRFRHALLRDAAYESLLKKERRRIHGAVADTLLGSSDAGARPEVVAAHLSRAERPGEAVSAWEKASRRAGRQLLFMEAAAHLAQALSQLDSLAPSDERDAIETRLRLRLGQYHGALDQSAPVVGAHLRRSLELASQRNDVLSLIEGRLTLAAHYQAVTDYRAVHRTLDLAEEAATSQGADWFIPMVGLMKGAVLVWQGRLSDGQGVIVKAVERVGETMDAPPSNVMSMPGFLVDVVVGGYVLYALAESLAGRSEHAERVGEWGSQLAAQKGSVHAQCLSWTTRAIMQQLAGDISAVERLASQSLSLADDCTTAQFRWWSQALLAWADGRVPDVGAELNRVQFMRPYLLSLQADRLGDPRRSLDLIEEAIREARATGERFCESELLRMRAARQLEAGDEPAAAASRQEAISVAHEQGAFALEEKAMKLNIPGGGAPSVERGGR
jgi:class 3 adenylate cyclase